MRRRNLTLQNRHLRRIQRLIPNTPKHRRKIRRRNRAHVRRDVAERRPQRRQRPIEEVVPRTHALHLIERRVPRPDHGDRTRRHARAVPGRQPAPRAKRFERAHDVGEGGWAVGLDVHEEVEGLSAGRVVDAVVRGAGGQVRGVWVLALQDGQDLADV